MNNYRLSIYNENVRNLLIGYVEYTKYLDGIEIMAINEDEARKQANMDFNLMRAVDAHPSMTNPEIPDVNDYWDLWLNPNYTKIEKIY